jgi:hypothetical protein
MAIATMPVLHTKTRGDIAEAYITARLLELGKSVLKPVGDNARYDLVIHEPADGSFVRVQCKTAYLDPRAHDVLKFPTCSSACHTNAGKRDYRGHADCFGVWFPRDRSVFLVPVDHVGTSEASLRLAATRNGQAKGVRYAESYLI